MNYCFLFQDEISSFKIRQRFKATLSWVDVLRLLYSLSVCLMPKAAVSFPASLEKGFVFFFFFPPPGLPTFSVALAGPNPKVGKTSPKGSQELQPSPAARRRTGTRETIGFSICSPVLPAMRKRTSAGELTGFFFHLPFSRLLCGLPFPFQETGGISCQSVCFSSHGVHCILRIFFSAVGGCVGVW